MKAVEDIARPFWRFYLKLPQKLWITRGRLPLLNLPIPWRLPYGSFILLYPDEMGFNLLPRPWKPRVSTYEENDWRFINRFIKQGMVFLDLGANQGFYTLLVSKLVGTEGKVFAFEPASPEYQKLKRNLQINRAQNVILQKMAIGAHDGTTDFFLCLDGRGSRSSLRTPPEEVKARTKIERIPIKRLDSYVEANNIHNIDFIKIDVEGGERDILKGAKNVLTTIRPLVMIELADIATQQFGYPSQESYKLLENYRYVLFRTTTNGYLLTEKPKDIYRENLIAVPNEKLGMIAEFRR